MMVVGDSVSDNFLEGFYFPASHGPVLYSRFDSICNSFIKNKTKNKIYKMNHMFLCVFFFFVCLSTSRAPFQSFNLHPVFFPSPLHFAFFSYIITNLTALPLSSSILSMNFVSPILFSLTLPFLHPFVKNPFPYLLPFLTKFPHFPYLLISCLHFKVSYPTPILLISNPSLIFHLLS